MSHRCDHAELILDPSSHAAIVGYTRPETRKLISASSITGRVSKAAQGSKDVPSPSCFPAPLVLPGDDIAYDPKQPVQSVRAWSLMKDRNVATAQRRTIYVIEPPGSDESRTNHVPLRDILQQWTRPKVVQTKAPNVDQPATKEVAEYIQAYYHGMTVKRLSNFFTFTSWDEDAKSNYIGLVANDEIVRIRTRPCPDGIFIKQINLDDLLDACISSLPSDAYSVVLLTHHDLYEDEEDDFCCGRAYGESRVTVVSSARYNPLLDQMQNVEREHAWPASHCKAYVEACCTQDVKKMMAEKQRHEAAKPLIDLTTELPIQTAVAAFNSAPNIQDSKNGRLLAGAWMARVCRTVSHELGHCFGLEHCAYYACSMQSTASTAEDVRQPPYLCPVDLVKVLQVTGADEADRYRALLDFCKKHEHVQLFAAFSAWLAAMLDIRAEASHTRVN